MIFERRMGKNGPSVPVVGMGTMSWPGCRYGERSEVEPSVQTARECLESALQLGITLVDTAEGYGRGLAEEHLGRAMAELRCRDNFFLVTKTGPLFGDEQTGGRTCNLGREHLLLRVDGCLSRLQVDTIDLLLAHWPDDQTPLEETMGAVDELRSAGKIRHFGVSNFPNALLGEALKFGEVVCNQLPCSLADRSIEDGRRQFCLERGVGIMAYSPIGKGVLSGKYDAGHLPPPGDYRHQRAHFRENLETNLRIAGRVRELAVELQTEPVAVALAWTIVTIQVV